MVTKKLEDALREVAGINTIESTSRGGISVISIELDDRVDASNNEQIFSKIRDKLADAEGDLPPEASKPSLDDKRGAVAYSLIAALTWKGAGEPGLGILDRLAKELSDRLRTRNAMRLADWATKARELTDSFSAEAGGGVALSLVFDQNRYTSVRLGALGANLGAGAAVVVLVVLITMGWRAALIVGAALPLSAAVTLFELDVAGQQIHQTSIFGMIIAIGLLIDNAIVMTDEVRTRRTAGLPPVAAAELAVRHLFPPLAASTFTTILGFMPVFLLPGNAGDFVGPIAVSVIPALAASFAISMTIIPALAVLLARPVAPDGRWWRDGWNSARLGIVSGATLSAALQRPMLTAAACLVLPAAGFIAAGSLGMQFFPAADRDQFEVQVWLAPDTAVTRTAETVLAMEEVIRGQGEVQDIAWVVGGSSPPGLLQPDQRPGQQSELRPRHRARFEPKGVQTPGRDSPAPTFRPLPGGPRSSKGL